MEDVDERDDAFKARAEHLAGRTAENSEEVFEEDNEGEEDEEEDDDTVEDSSINNLEDDTFLSGAAGTRKWCWSIASRLSTLEYDQLKPEERFQVLHFLCDCASGLEQFREIVNDRQIECRSYQKDLTTETNIQQAGGKKIPQRERKIKGAFIKRLFRQMITTMKVTRRGTDDSNKMKYPTRLRKTKMRAVKAGKKKTAAALKRVPK